jgi:gliding motility-associated-like protein
VNGCESNRVPVRVVTTAKPAPPTIANPVVRCQGDTPTPLSAQGQGIRWYTVPTGGTGSTTAPVPPTGWLDTTSYWVTQTVNGCESDRAQVDVIVYYKPNALILASKATLCQYDTVSFHYFGNALPDASYTWTFPSPGSSLLSGTGQGPLVARFDSAGTYVVKLQVNNHGCLSPEAQQIIKVNKTPVIKMRLDPDICVDELLKVQLNYVSAGQNTYTWNFDGATVLYSIPGTGPYDIVWHTPGLHVVSVTASNGICVAPPLLDSVYVHALPDAKIRYVEKNNFCAGDSVIIQAADSTAAGYKYTWTPSGFFGGQHTPTVYSTVFYTSDIKLTVKDRYGCESADSVLVQTQPCCDIYFPDAFTPNGDGRNDLFRPITIGNHNISTYRITNRWGQQLFETDDERRGWDGKLNGTPQEIGTYYYYIRYKCYDGQYIEKKGSFMLIR